MCTNAKSRGYVRACTFFNNGLSLVKQLVYLVYCRPAVQALRYTWLACRGSICSDSDRSEDSADTSRSESPLFSPPDRSLRLTTPSPGRDVAGYGSSFGRPRKSPVWEYFVYNPSNNRSVCQILNQKSAESSSVEESSVCGESLLANLQPT